jgi:hypothetical protein
MLCTRWRIGQRSKGQSVEREQVRASVLRVNQEDVVRGRSRWREFPVTMNAGMVFRREDEMYLIVCL